MGFNIEDDGYWHRNADMHRLPRSEEHDVLSVHESYTGGKSVLREVTETIVLTLLIFFVVRAVVQNFKVEGESMLPSLVDKQFILVNKAQYFQYDANFIERIFNKDVPARMQYLFRGPQRGDIIVFEAPKEDAKDFIKRVIALEGEYVEVRADPSPGDPPENDCGTCGVYVNGVKLNEPYIKEHPTYAVEPFKVPPGHVYVLGDNRNNSSDSHIWQSLDVDRIIGTAFVSYWQEDQPMKYIGLLPHPTYAEIEQQP